MLIRWLDWLNHRLPQSWKWWEWRNKLCDKAMQYSECWDTGMLTRSLAKNNYLCIQCTCTINLKKLTERERKNYFGTLRCPECYSDDYESDLTLFDV